MDDRRKVPNPLALAALAWLLTEPMHPYELGRRLEESGKDRYIKYNRSSLYMVIEQLGRAGFIREHETVRDGQRPPRTVYAITEAGRQECADWIQSLVANPRDEFPHFTVALSLLGLLDPADAVELLRHRLTALADKAEAIRKERKGALDSGVQWIFLIEDQYTVTVIEAEVAFVRDLIESLSDPDYVKTWHDTMGRDA